MQAPTWPHIFSIGEDLFVSRELSGAIILEAARSHTGKIAALEPFAKVYGIWSHG